ncbi:hypothetical protein [Streptomyces platensis]|uniref:hypothetical protein n=1 Tax=Streptomyces platensis TaxID=58346 RepID=UPI001F330819|nr:hypothetical protein [Streptomyces platensis]MCF3142165.1 hypothetical protein [Streptomyces platensis]
MSDDSGYSDDSSDSGCLTTRSGGSRGPADLSVLRRAMRWETFALVAILVILAMVAS